MQKIKENLKYIINAEDSDAIKFEKLLKKMQESNIEIYSKKFSVSKIENNIVLSIINFTLKDSEKEETIEFPYVSSAELFNKNIYENIINAKKLIIFELLGIVPATTTITNKNNDSNISQASYKQLNLIRDKMKYDNCKNIVESKLKELSKNLDDLSKDEASTIITALGRK